MDKSVSMIGILYIATGPYIAFWKQFYDSFEMFFLKDTKKIYYVFTDAESIYKEENERVNKIFLAQAPWPLITLLRFHSFLSIEEKLMECDYLMFSNSNIACARQVEEQEILPTGKNTIFVTVHPGYVDDKKKYCPFERSKKSTAYVPYSSKCPYVIGAFFGGKRDDFLEMSRKLKENIDMDLKKNVIARWHDESHLNAYIQRREDVRFLTPGYCYPFGFELQEEKVIYAVEKRSVFDIDTFKGMDISRKNKGFAKRVLNKLGKTLHKRYIDLAYLVDTILGK